MTEIPAVTSLDELRSVVNLGARKDVDRVPDGDILRQEKTVLRALELLRGQPGVVLADEVGMGKTFEALGVAAAFREAGPENRVVVLTPGPDLNTKWDKEIRRFSDRVGDARGKYSIHDFGDQVAKVSRLGDLVAALRDGAPVVVAPISGFVNDPTAQQTLLSLYCHWKGVAPQTRAAMFRRYRKGRLHPIDVETTELFPGVFLKDVKKHLKSVFRGPRDDRMLYVDGLYDAEGLTAFGSQAMSKALDLARYRLASRLIPDVALLIVDEAHKLKNAYTGRAQGVTTVFDRKFDKALFLTATPFQLDIGELKQVFNLFGHARSAPDDLPEQTAGIFEAIRDYQLRYEAFHTAWATLDEAAAAELGLHFERDPEFTDVPTTHGLESVVRSYLDLARLKKERVEPQLQQWMIRSLREDKRVYRERTKAQQDPSGADSLPFLLYERLIAELFRVKSPTHKAAVQVNMVSSYGAARTGALLADGAAHTEASVEAYRAVLQRVLDQRHTGAEHPKLKFVAEDALQAAADGEKTLVFCTRVETLRELARNLGDAWEERILARWQSLYPGATRVDIFGERREGDAKDERGRHANLQARFRDGNTVLYLALRERYVQTALTLTNWPEQHLETITQRANELLGKQRVKKSSAERIDYQVAKRCVEQATAILWREREPAEAKNYAGPLERLCHPDFISLGYDLEADELEGDGAGDHVPKWTIGRDVADLVVGFRPDLWGMLSGKVCELSERARIDLVERLARYLVYRQVPFLIELLEEARSAGVVLDPIDSRQLLTFVGRFWTKPPGRRWVERLAAFVDYYAKSPPTIQEELLRAIERASFVRHTAEGESREKLREAFNTPLFPMVLVANEVMQEGLDLHKNCRRVVHHDLAWNPAQLEQRVGRVDRLGSRTAQLRQKVDPDAKLTVLYPLIRNTIDERLHRSVQAREKWLEFLLGAPPDLQEYWLGEGEPQPLPQGMADALKIELGVG